MELTTNKLEQAEDLILNKLSDEMAESNIDLFIKYLKNDNMKHVEVTIPQIAKILAMSTILFVDTILEGSNPIPENDIKGPTNAEEATIDVINMTADILKVIIDNKETEYYKSKK